MNKFFRSHSLLIGIVLLGFLLRIYKVDSIPGSLNPDEVALGYNAFSLLTTGADEHGKFLPLSLQSFGDWKLPMYSYLTIPFIWFLGINDSLNHLIVRLPSILAGTIGIILIYTISILLFRKKAVAIFAALFFALSPWSIYFSRVAYEVNVATTLFLAGVVCFLLSTAPKRSKLLLLSSLFFGLTLFTYHSYIIITPLFFFALLVLYRKQLARNKIFFVSIALFLLFVGVSYVSVNSGGVNKFNTTTVFNSKNILYERVENFRGDSQHTNNILNQVFHNKFLGVSYHIGQNYINSFSPQFLFDKGGEKLIHNLPGFGNLYIFDALLLIVGVAGIFWNREKFILLATWLLIAPIPSSLTLDAPNTTRLFPLLPVFVIISGYGGYVIYSYIMRKRGLYYGIGLVLIGVFILNVFYFIDIYFVHFNYHKARFWHYGYKELVVEANKYDKNHKIVMRGPENFPYIYFLFYNQVNPRDFQNSVEYYPPNNEGFLYVKRFGRYEFVNDLNGMDTQKNALYIDDRNFHIEDQLIRLPNGDAIFRLYTVE